LRRPENPDIIARASFVFPDLGFYDEDSNLFLSPSFLSDGKSGDQVAVHATHISGLEGGEYSSFPILFVGPWCDRAREKGPIPLGSPTPRRGFRFLRFPEVKKSYGNLSPELIRPLHREPLFPSCLGDRVISRASDYSSFLTLLGLGRLRA